MKNVLIYSFATLLLLSACKRSSSDSAEKEVENLTEQNNNDDAAIKKYMEEHYLDNLGRVMAYTEKIKPDADHVKLTDLNPITLASGVIIIKRDNAQPNPGTNVGNTDIIRIMLKANTFLSKNDNGITYTSQGFFANSIESTGVPQVDPAYYYVKEKVLTDNKHIRAYYEIEGLQEGLRQFQSFNIDDSSAYNLQGVIIIPSRLAFARDTHYAYSGYSWRNRNFVVSFQLYKSTPRPNNLK